MRIKDIIMYKLKKKESSFGQFVFSSYICIIITLKPKCDYAK